MHGRMSGRKMRERGGANGFRLEKTNPKFDQCTVLRALLNFCHRPSARLYRGTGARGQFRSGRLDSFMAQNNRRAHGSDVQDAVLRGRKFMRYCFRFALLGGCAWVVLESAKALSVF
jgi:hypothetical protein